jgi:glutathione S-transferase
MSKLKIFLGNKNYSSWSLRPWLVLKHLGVPFEEQVVPLDQPSTAEEIRKFSPSGRVPVLVDGDTVVWDSLAICEYLNELFPGRQLWPSDARARATARSVSAEMHSGFAALRENLPMKFRESFPNTMLQPEVKADIARILQLWNDCRSRFGAAGPYLFGDFSIADAMYAPVVSRFNTYGVALEGTAAAYASAIWKLPSIQEWLAAARAEPFRMARYEAQAETAGPRGSPGERRFPFH